MTRPCHYCGEQHYEAIDIELCLRDALKREDIAYKCLAKSYEDLVKTHDLEHEMIKRLITNMELRRSGIGAPDEKLDILTAEQLLARHHHPDRPQQKG